MTISFQRFNRSSNPIVFRILAVMLGTFGVLFALEIACLLFHWISTGRMTSSAELVDLEINANQNKGAAWARGPLEEGCGWVDMFQAHPYLSYIKHKNPPCAEPLVNEQGFRGANYPNQHEANYFTILVTGGSVAEDQFQDIDGKPNTLEVALNEFYTPIGGRKFRVLNGAMAAWHQPQPFLNFVLNAPIIDGLISLEGFNEVTTLRQWPNSKFDIPVDPIRMKMISEPTDMPGAIAAVVDGALYKWAAQSTLVRHSHLVYLVIARLRKKMRQIAQDRSQMQNVGKFNPFEWPKALNTNESKRLNLERYRYLVRATHALSQTMGIKAVTFLQPVPAIDKTLTDQEKLGARDLNYRDDYLEVVKTLLTLQKENIPVVSLTDVFKNEKERIYIDMIHFYPPGKALVLHRILSELEKHWGLQRK